MSRVLVVPGRSVAEMTDEAEELFRAVLKGHSSLVANWEATCERLERKEGVEKSIPYPVFIPTYGRVHKANLNWNADHVFGPVVSGRGGILHPVICIVVEPSQEEDYREVWPHALMLVLPENGRGAGFARWVIQKTCTRALVRLQLPQNPDILSGRESWKVRRLPFCWIADDGLSMFYKLVWIDGNGADGSSGCQRLTKREAPEGKPMFKDAFLSVQANPILSQIAVAGFLRDDGTAVCKRLEWKTNELSLYKIVLLNLGTLNALGVEYQQDLQMYEDICLTHEVLLKDGGRTLKCQNYCFRASHVKLGGCADQRVQRGGTLLRDLIAPLALKKLPSARQQVVRNLLQWVQSKESKFANDGSPPRKKPNKQASLVASKPKKPESLKRNREKKPPTPRDHKARKLAIQPAVSSNISSSSSSSSSSCSSSVGAPESPAVVLSDDVPLLFLAIIRGSERVARKLKCVPHMREMFMYGNTCIYIHIYIYIRGLGELEQLSSPLD